VEVRTAGCNGRWDSLMMRSGMPVRLASSAPLHGTREIVPSLSVRRATCR
jgi:hypothetical protein